MLKLIVDILSVPAIIGRFNFFNWITMSKEKFF